MLEKVKEIVAENLGADINTLTEETSFKDDLGADSLDLFEMVMALEEEANNIASLLPSGQEPFWPRPGGRNILLENK